MTVQGSMTIERPAIIGAGLIGASMAAMFSAAGLDVTVWDPDREAEPRFRQRVTRARDHLAQLDQVGTGRVRWCESMKAALREADWVQENAPENLAVKHELYGEIEAVLDPDAILASSTSAMTWSELSSGVHYPNRLITLHPFNPAHLMPLVEIYGTDPTRIATACQFFSALGKEPIVLKRDAVGHLANRLASALWREAVHIVAEGIADVAALDAALVHGPGLRWSIAGAHLSYHLGGGAEGIEGYLNRLGTSQERRWASLGTPELTDSVKQKLIYGVREEADGRSVEELEERRDALLIEALRARADGGTL